SEEPVVAGGTYALNMIDCGGDGAVYACNLAESATVGAFTIYRWADDASTTPPAAAYGPADLFASDRAGDGLKVRGSGTGTEILVAHNGDEVARQVDRLSAGVARKIGRAARARALAEHTYAHRAAQFDAVIEGRGVGRPLEMAA
ncbi:MAG: glycosyltransferase, partial [Pseudomonadota bacterium]